jgi:hypothetical protein
MCDVEKKKITCCKMYLAGGKRINKWYTKLFSMLLIATVLKFLVIYERNMDGNSVQCDVPLHHGGDSTVKRLAEWYFPRRTRPIEKCKLARQCVWSATHMMKEEKLYIMVRCVMLI